MTAGAPHIADTHSRTGTAATAAQAAHIRQLLDLGNTTAMVVAAVGCSYARVQQVAYTQPAPAAVPAPRTQPQPARVAIPAPRVSRRHPTQTLPVQPAEPDHVTRDRLVRNIAADPVLLAWLYEHNARVIESVADALLAEHGLPAAATALRVAGAHRVHTAPVWGNPAGPPRVRCGEQCDEVRGYQAHLRAGQEPCARSRQANNDYKRATRRRTDTPGVAS